MIVCSLIERIIFLSGFDADISYENFELLSIGSGFFYGTYCRLNMLKNEPSVNKC